MRMESIGMWRALLSEDETAGLRGSSKHWQVREHFEGMYLLLYISPQPLAASAIVRQEHHSTSREDATQLGWPRCFAPRLARIIHEGPGSTRGEHNFIVTRTP